MFILDPKRWSKVISTDVQPKDKLPDISQIYYKKSEEATIPGQIEEGSPVFWHCDVSPIFCGHERGREPELKVSDITFWQDLEDLGSIYWNIGSRGLRYWHDGSDGIIKRPKFGTYDELGVWISRYKRAPIVEVLNTSSFKSLTKSTKHCLAVMLAEANDAGKVFALSDKNISNMTGLSTDSISRHLKSLMELKLIKEVNKLKKQPKVNGEYKELKQKDYKICFGYQKMKYEGRGLYRYQDRARVFRGRYILSPII